MILIKTKRILGFTVNIKVFLIEPLQEGAWKVGFLGFMTLENKPFIFIKGSPFCNLMEVIFNFFKGYHPSHFVVPMISNICMIFI